MVVSSTHDSPQLLAFIKVELSAQAQELQTYLHSKGADIASEPSAEGLLHDMKQIIAVCDACFAESSDAEIESVLNSIVSIIILDSVEGHDQLIIQFCTKLASCDNHQLVCLKVLKLLFSSLKSSSATRYDVYYSLLSVAGAMDQMGSAFTSVADMEALLGPSLTLQQKQNLLRLVYRELLRNKRSEATSRIMLELLSTYTEENASQAAQEARDCVLAALKDPDILLLDYLTALKPVRRLENTPLYQLLDIFVNQSLVEYQSFYGQHKAQVEEWGLEHERNVVKMRQLTFLKLAQTQQVMSFEYLEKMLQLEADQVEDFLINVLRTKMVRARMDQLAKKVHISYATPRTFGTAEWRELRDVLLRWKASIVNTRSNMEGVVSAQTDMVPV